MATSENTQLGQALGGTHSPFRLAVVVVVGGTASELTGGKFANGAVTAAFAHIFNDLRCAKNLRACFGTRPTKAEIDRHYRSGTGWPVFAETMDPSWLDGTQFRAISVGSSSVIETDWSKEWILSARGDRDIYGSFRATRVDSDNFKFEDVYNFDIKSGFSLKTIFRNLATSYGYNQAMKGAAPGTVPKGFRIIGTQKAPIPK